MSKLLLPLKEIEVIGHHLSIYGTWDNPLFLSKDLCSIIGFSSNISAVGRFVVPATDGGRIKAKAIVHGSVKYASFLNIAGLRKVFAQWRDSYPLCDVVLDSIEKEIGNYAVAKTVSMSDEELLAKALLLAKDIISRQRMEIRRNAVNAGIMRKISINAEEIQQLASQAK